MKNLADKIHYQQCVLKAIRSDLKNPEKLDAQINEKLSQITTLQSQVESLQHRKDNLQSLYNDELNKLKLLKQAQTQPLLEELLATMSKIEELSSDD